MGLTPFFVLHIQWRSPQSAHLLEISNRFTFNLWKSIHAIRRYVVYKKKKNVLTITTRTISENAGFCSFWGNFWIVKISNIKVIRSFFTRIHLTQSVHWFECENVLLYSIDKKMIFYNRFWFQSVLRIYVI